jgi:hypothetical protein
MSYTLTRALPSYTITRALPSYTLPSRALHLIREYSRPLTRPDWRQSKPIISTYRLYLIIKYVMYVPIITPKNLLHSMILYNIGETEWYYAYVYIKFYGLNIYLHEYTDHNMLKADSIEDAISHFSCS